MSKKLNIGNTTFYCFSPPVMLATFAIEIGLLAYVLIRYKMSPAVRLISALLLLLATFQLAEFYVCGGFGMTAEVWSRIGFVAITFLPPLGLHLAHVLAGRPPGKAVFAAYATGAIWALVFGLSDWAFVGHACTGNYVIFQLKDYVGTFYSFYYYGWLVGGILISYILARQVPKARTSLRWMVYGYLAFMVPTAVINVLQPDTTAGIPSIMCGFAVLLALALVFKVLPAYQAAKRTDRSFPLTFQR